MKETKSEYWVLKITQGNWEDSETEMYIFHSENEAMIARDESLKYLGKLIIKIELEHKKVITNTLD